MGTVIPQTRYEILEPGTYRVKLSAAAVADGPYGEQVVMRFDLLEEGLTNRSVKAWAAAKLSGGRRPSKLYSWTSALLFGGKSLPEGYDLDTDSLRHREALALIEVVEKDGLLYNRIAQLFPLRAARVGLSPNPPFPAESEAAASPLSEGWMAVPDGDGDFDAETHGDFDEEAPW